MMRGTDNGYDDKSELLEPEDEGEQDHAEDEGNRFGGERTGAWSCRKQARRLADQIGDMQQAVVRLHECAERNERAVKVIGPEAGEDPDEVRQDQTLIALKLMHVSAMALSSAQGTWDRFRTELPDHAFGRALAKFEEGERPDATVISAAINALADVNDYVLQAVRATGRMSDTAH